MNEEFLYVDDNPEAKIVFSYSNIMPKLSKVVTQASKNTQIFKRI